MIVLQNKKEISILKYYAAIKSEKTPLNSLAPKGGQVKLTLTAKKNYLFIPTNE